MYPGRCLRHEEGRNPRASRDGEGECRFSHHSALTIRGSIRYSTGCYRTALQLVASGKVHVSELVTHTFKSEQAEEAFELVRQGKESVLKVVIEGVTSESNGIWTLVKSDLDVSIGQGLIRQIGTPTTLLR